MSDVYEFSDSFQMKILALIARDKSTFMSYRDVIKPKYFRKDIHIDLMRIIQEHYDKEIDRSKTKGTAIAPPTTEVLFEEIRKLTSNNKNKSKLKEQYQDIILDMSEIDLSDAEYIKDNLIAFGKRSALEHSILESVDDIQKGDYTQIEDRIRSALQVGESIQDLGSDYFGEAPERMKLYAKGIDGVERIPTGMVGLDKVMKGGLGRGELGVIIAPPNRGKLKVVC